MYKYIGYVHVSVPSTIIKMDLFNKIYTQVHACMNQRHIKQFIHELRD